jgi:hypothetical protein
VQFEIRPLYEIRQSNPVDEKKQSITQDSEHLRFFTRYNKAETVSDRPYKGAFRSEETVLDADEFLPGSNHIVTKSSDGESIEGAVTNWKIKAGETTKWEPVNLIPVFNDKVTQIFKNQYLTPRSPFCSLAMPRQGFGSWCHPSDTFAVDDSGLRAVSQKNNGRIVLPNGIPFETPGTGQTPGDGEDAAKNNIAFTSQWDNYPREIAVPLSGNASHIYLLMAGSTTSMQSQFDNGEVIVTYADGSTERLALRNPTTWWPIDQDYFIDDYAFRRPEPIPPRVDLKTGKVRILDLAEFKGKGGIVPGGAATVLDLPLDKSKELKSLTVRALANEVVIGLMSATLVR